MITVDVTFLFGIISLHYKIPEIELKNLQDGLIVREENSNNLNEGQTANHEQAINKQKIEQWIDDFRMMLEATLGLRSWMKTTLKHIKVTQLDWSTNIALSNAAHTATLTGFAWALKSTLIGFLSYHISLRQRPKLFVVPKFGVPPAFVSELQCTARIRLGYAVYAMFIFVFRILRENKGLRKWLKIIAKSKSAKKAKSSDSHDHSRA